MVLWVKEASGERGPLHRRPEGQHRMPHAKTCRALGVSQAWFYKWRHGDASPRHARREQLTVKIRQLFARTAAATAPRGSPLICVRRAGR